MINSDCYEFKEFNYEFGFFDSFVDSTYIITMFNSSRHQHIKQQLKFYQPTKKIFILCNYGYKNCKKKLFENKTNYDLTDAYFQIFDHANKNNFNTILILEDDFIFDSIIKDKQIIQEIKNLFNKKKDEKMFFNLGPMLNFFYPEINNNIYKSIRSYASQANIYNKNIINDILNNNIRNISHWDDYLNSYNNYFYKYPLCYQTFPETENQKNWNSLAKNNYFYKFNKIFTDLNIFVFKILKLNKQPQPGYEILYTIQFIINYLFILIIFFIILSVIYFLLKKLI